MSMFDNYPQSEDYIPNNRPKCHKPLELTIMTGETASHTFDIPFNIDESCGEVEVIYKLGLTPILVKNSFFLDITSEGNHSIIKCDLSADDTALFKNVDLDARVQIKFYMNNSSIVYSEIYPVKVTNALDIENMPTQNVPSMIAGLGGFGYTED